jgi:hypothetical protein
MHVGLILGALGAVALVLLLLGLRADLRITRVTAGRNPGLRPTGNLNTMPTRQAVRALLQYSSALRRHAKADPEIRRELRFRTLCYVGAAIFGLLPLFYAALVIDTLAR